jgi:hypothetical protein
VTDVLALDLAKTTGWARGLVGDEAPRCGSVTFGKPSCSQQMVCVHAGEWFIEQLRDKPDIVAVEASLPPLVIKGKSNTDHDLGIKLHGVLDFITGMRSIFKVHRYAVQSIRAHFIDLSVCAKGEAKQMVLRKCRSLGWLESADDDAADACAVWSYQVGLLDRDQVLRVSPLFNKRARVV